MSSRALRKLQKQREAQERQDDLGDESEDDEPAASIPRPKINAFDLLGDQDDDSEDETDTAAATTPETQHVAPPSEDSQPTTSKKKKKKSKKRQKKAVDPAEAKVPDSEDPEADEIDLALKALALKTPPQAEDQQKINVGVDAGQITEQELCALLKIDPKKLVALNEMKILFGNAAVETRDSPSESPSGNRRRDRNRRALDLGAALTGRYSPASRGQELSGVALRKNVLMPGKAEWPKATSGGLGMEIVQKFSSGVVEYELVHNTAYKDVQRQFDMCVESMQPERMIELLQYNPYNVSTLLQVSEIAKHQGDHAVSADLLERALFNIGRSAQSSFGNTLKEGKARLDFTIKENRELWLAGWRYINNLGGKGTWKTAYEWTKLLLSIDPDDPYCLNLVIDHVAVRAREFGNFVALCLHPNFKEKWLSFPNIQCSLGLAYMHLKKPKECREVLHSAVAQFPWIFCRLAQELNISPVPKAIWGTQAPSQAHELLCELYIARAKDIWNIPEATALLVEVADSVTISGKPPAAPEVTRDMARHVILSDIAAATTHLPRHFVARQLSSSDPLPPNEAGVLNVHSTSMVDDILNLLRTNEQPRGQAGDQLQEPAADDSDMDTDSAEEMDMAGVYLPPSQTTEWLYGGGAEDLVEFFNINGVDPGNWEADVDMSPIQLWVRRLQLIRRQDWPTAITAVADLLDSSTGVVQMVLNTELERQTAGSAP